MDTEAFLSKVPLFTEFNRRQRRRVAGLLVARTYSDGQQIVTQGKPGLGLYIVVTGQAKATRNLLSNEVVDVAVFGPTEFFGEMSLLAAGQRTATVSAVGETSCLILTRADFLELLLEDAHMAVVVAQTIARHFQALVAKM